MVGKIDKAEWITLLSLLLFAIIWMIFLIPWLEINSDFLAMNPIMQYVLFNLGFIVLTTIIFGFTFSFLMKHKFDIITTIRSGIASWLGFSFILDMWQPPYYISQAGQILITNQGALPQTSVDAMMTYIWTPIIPDISIFGISLLYIFVYFVTPLIAGIIMALLMAPNTFRKLIGLS